MSHDDQGTTIKLVCLGWMWINTAILVIPAFVQGWWEITFGSFTGIRLPMGLQLAIGLYIGISFILQWRVKYGGYEVVAIPILLFKRRYTSYCIPLVAADAVEKAIVDRKINKQANIETSR